MDASRRERRHHQKAAVAVGAVATAMDVEQRESRYHRKATTMT